MTDKNFNKEWLFIQTEVHTIKARAENLLEREMLFVLQILFSKKEILNYKKLKRLYLAEREK
ncbi:MAG: hypothetical protein LBS73_07115 [Campylobacteraceae bacterium]|jgi:hypothetical protein|nr:hypothetical protein [Campylobacteraceae bacterium]